MSEEEEEGEGKESMGYGRMDSDEEGEEREAMLIEKDCSIFNGARPNAI